MARSCFSLSSSAARSEHAAVSRVRPKVLAAAGRMMAGLAVAGPSLLFPPAAQAQSLAYTIPTGRLKQALDAFARQSGFQIIYREPDIQGRKSPGAKGRMSSGAALQALLAGSGLTWRVAASGAIAIVPAQLAQAPTSGRRAITERPREAGTENPVEIVITGSRLARPGVGVSAMTSTIGREELLRTGKTAIGEALNDLPPFASTISQSNSTQIDTGAGLNMLDLRGLGIDRTLVLQNGRRHISGGFFTTAVDVNTIPTELIDRIEVVSGGGSAIYGSDAVAGVVNFILKRDFEGLEVRGQAGSSRHGDAGQSFLGVTAGASFAEGRGNISASAEASHQDDWYASDRPAYRTVGSYIFVDTDPSNSPNGSDGTPDRILVPDMRGFSVSNGGSFVSFDPETDRFSRSYLFQPDGSLVRQTGERVGLPPSGPFNGGNGSNLREGHLFSYAPDVQRLSLNALGHFTVSDAFEPFFEAKYVRIASQGSSFGSFFSVGVWSPRESFKTDNPFLTPETAQFIRSELELAPGEESGFFFRRNFAELGPIAQRNRRETYRIVGGARGRVGAGWSYEATANFSSATSRTRFTGNVNVQRFLLSLDAVRDPSTGQIVCRSQIDPAAALPLEEANRAAALSRLAQDVAACVPLNPFGEGSVTAAVRDYLLAEGANRSRITQRVFNGFATGDTRGWLELPGGPIGIAFGAEHRRETFSSWQDDLLAAGLTHSTAFPTYDPPNFSVTEAFGEVRLPVLRNLSGIEELTLSGAGRLANYNRGIGTVFAWNAGAEWRPFDGLRFRINRSRAVRAPNLFEAYQPASQNFASGILRDPCSRQSIGSGSPNREANCHADGVPQGFQFTYSASFPFISGGNPDLHEERSDSLTLGGSFQPAFFRNLSLSVDYYSIRVGDVITSPMAQSILNACYDAASLDNQFCRLFERHEGPGYGPNGEVPGQILRNSLQVQPLNYAALKVRGVDVEAAYRQSLPSATTLNARLRYTLSLQNDSFLNPEDPGRKDQNLLELGNPRHALNLDLGLARGKATFSYRFRYLSKMSVGPIENIRSVQGRDPEDADAFSRDFYSAATYHNLRLDLAVNSSLSLYAGVDNLTDRLPPPNITGVNDAGSIYDNVGRFLYAGASARF